MRDARGADGADAERRRHRPDDPARLQGVLRLLLPARVGEPADGQHLDLVGRDVRREREDVAVAQTGVVGGEPGEPRHRLRRPSGGSSATTATRSGRAAPGTASRTRDEPYGCSDADDSRKKHIWPIFMPGHSRIGSVATLDSSSVTCPENPGSMNPAVECVSRPSRPSDDLPSSRAAMSSGSVTASYVDPSTNSPGCRTNGLARGGLDQPRQVRLVGRRVDERVLVVVEQPEVPVEPHVDARRLEHGGLVGVEGHAARLELGPDVTVGEQHGATVVRFAGVPQGSGRVTVRRGPATQRGRPASGSPAPA